MAQPADPGGWVGGCLTNQPPLATPLPLPPPPACRSDLSHRIDRRIGVIDAVQIDHMRPSGVSGLYQRVGGLEKAAADQAAFRARYGVRDEFFDMVKPGHRGEGRPVVGPP